MARLVAIASSGEAKPLAFDDKYVVGNLPQLEGKQHAVAFSWSDDRLAHFGSSGFRVRVQPVGASPRTV